MTIFNKLWQNLWQGARNWKASVSFILTLGFLIWLSLLYPSSPLNIKKLELAVPKEEQAENKSSFDNISLEAKSAYVFDVLKLQPIFEFNAEAKLPLASLTKIMTALAIEENLPSYLLVSMPKEAISQAGDDGFLVEEQWKVSDLNKIMLVSSSNDAAAALSSAFEEIYKSDFIALMNKKSEELGLEQTYFLNPTGLDFSKNIAGGYSSAKDVAKLLLYIVEKYPVLAEATSFSSLNVKNREFKTTDKIINDLPGFIAGKTGFTDLAGGNLAVMVEAGYGHPIIIVVLGSSLEGRFNDVKTLYRAAISDMIKI